MLVRALEILQWPRSPLAPNDNPKEIRLDVNEPHAPKVPVRHGGPSSPPLGLPEYDHTLHFVSTIGHSQLKYPQMSRTKNTDGAAATAAEGEEEEEKEEEEWRGVLHDVIDETKAYQDARQRKDEAAASQHSARVHQLMLKAAEVHPDPTVKEKFKKDAEEWVKGDTKARDALSHPFIQGIAILVATPFALAGGVLFGVGKLLVGLGDMLTLGKFRHCTS